MSSLLRCQITTLSLLCDLKTRASTRANMQVHIHTHAHTQTHVHKEYCLDDKLFRLSQACFQSSTSWNCKRTTRTFIRLRLLRSIDGCVLASPNDSPTSATTTPEDAAQCVSERPSNGRPHQVRTASVQGTVRPSRPRQRPTKHPRINFESGTQLTNRPPRLRQRPNTHTNALPNGRPHQV